MNKNIIEKIKIIIDKNKFLLFSFGLILMNILFLNSIIIEKTDKNFDNIYIIILTISVLMLLGITLFLFISKKKKIKIENKFLIIITIMGIMYMIAIPIGLVPDEKSHFLRAYEISEGHLISDKNENGNGGRVLPIEAKNIVADTTDYKYSNIIENFNIKTSNNKEFLIFSNTSLYSFICYLPQTIGIFIAKTFNLSMLETAYLGRIFNFITWTALIYFSIKFIPCYKNFIIFICLLPITMQEAISLSPDALTIAISISLISFVLYMVKTKKGKMTKKEFAIMSILAIIMSLCKIVYLPLCLLLYLIPAERFKSKKDKYIKIGILAFIVIITNIVWLKIASQYLVEFQPGVDSFQQVKNILAHPFNYIQILANTILTKSDFYLFGMLGKSLEWFNINLPYLYSLVTFILLVITIQKDTQNEQFNNNGIKINVLLILVCTVLLIFTSLYIQWTKVGNLVIEGVQGRYFIPLLLLLPILLTKAKEKKNYPNKKLDINYNENYILMFLIIQNMFALYTIFYTHI